MLELIFTHIPKTGGISFLHTLNEVYGEENVRQIWDYLPWRGDESLAVMNSHFFMEHGDFREVVKKSLRNVEAKVLFGHMPAWVLDGLFPGVPRITWLREPTEQILSRIFHFRKMKIVGAENIPPKELARSPVFRNLQFSYTGGWLHRGFLFVGILENYASDLRLLGSILGWPEVEAHHFHLTEFEEDKRQRLRDDELFLSDLKRWNSWDYALYDYWSRQRGK